MQQPRKGPMVCQAPSSSTAKPLQQSRSALIVLPRSVLLQVKSRTSDVMHGTDRPNTQCSRLFYELQRPRLCPMCRETAFEGWDRYAQHGTKLCMYPAGHQKVLFQSDKHRGWQMHGCCVIPAAPQHICAVCCGTVHHVN